MTIICWDQKLLAADTLTSSGGTTAYNRSKIQIIKQAAIATCGLTSIGDKFTEWFKQQNRDRFTADGDFAAIVFTKKEIQCYSADGDSDEDLISPDNIENKTAIGSGGATAYAEALMREAKMNAHKACELAAYYDVNCGNPVYSITRKQLNAIHPDFEGFWVGDHKVPVNKVKDYLITYKQWLKT